MAFNIISIHFQPDNKSKHSPDSSDEEREIFLQNRLPDPDTISDFREPILTWVQCPGETGIPSKNL